MPYFDMEELGGELVGIAKGAAFELFDQADKDLLPLLMDIKDDWAAALLSGDRQILDELTAQALLIKGIGGNRLSDKGLKVFQKITEAIAETASTLLKGLF